MDQFRDWLNFMPRDGLGFALSWSGAKYVSLALLSGSECVSFDDPFHLHRVQDCGAEVW